MRSLIIALLHFFRKIRLAWLKLFQKTESDIHDRRVVNGRAWDDFCDGLKAAGAALVYPGAPRDPFQQAEGIRYLSRLTRAALEAYVEFNDPAFPVLRRTVHETIKLGADNPDNHYLNAQISGRYEYRISGKRNSIHYVGFFTQNGNYGTTGGLAPCGVLENDDLVVDADGSFEIFLTKERRGKNWLPIEDETTLLMVRQTYLHRDREDPLDIIVENLDGRKVPEPMSAPKIDEGLKTAALFASGAPMLFARWAKGFQKHTNRLPQFDPEVSNAAGGDANIIYYHSHWCLEEHEALIIEVCPPECDMWNFQLNNYWMESLDYRYYNICINKGNAQYNNDGTVRIVVSNKNPQHPNWIETGPHREGTMCWRWYRISPGSAPVEPRCTVMNVHEIGTE